MHKKLISGLVLSVAIALSAAPALAAELPAAAPVVEVAPADVATPTVYVAAPAAAYQVLPLPMTPLSFSIDMSGLMDQAADFFNGLFPAFTPVIAIRLGLGIVLLVVSAIGGALSMRH